MTPERVSIWATATGIGFAAFMVTWLILNRLTSLWLPVPQAPIVALISAILMGSAVTWQRGSSFTRRFGSQGD